MFCMELFTNVGVFVRKKTSAFPNQKFFLLLCIRKPNVQKSLAGLYYSLIPDLQSPVFLPCCCNDVINIVVF